MLIKTKLQPPSLSSALLLRKNLIDRLRTATGAALILISGPAGSGKTSLACQWIEQEKLRVAWYSLDEEDNTPDQFFRYLLTALIQQNNHLASNLESLLANGLELSAEKVTPHLVKALSNQPNDIRLILDDFHQITNSDIHDGLARLIRYMPGCLQLVVLSRYSLPAPVDAAVVKKDRTDITAAELKFTDTEIVDLFRKVKAKGFPVDQVRNLNRHVEGWAAGLQFIGLSIHSKGAHLDLSSLLNQTHEQVGNYLLNDILKVQPQNIRQFIFTTALLDRFNPELCAEVTGMPDAEQILACLERMNFFLIPLDSCRNWYRYHHMFSEAIRRQMAKSDPGPITEILCKAAKWFAQIDHLEDALRCAFQSNDFEFAADLMEDYIIRYLETYDLTAGLRWISRLPERILDQRPLLRLLQCGFLSFSMELSDIKEILYSIENNGEPDFSRYSGAKLAFCEDLTACFKGMLHIYYTREANTVEQFQLLRNQISLQNPFLAGYIEFHIASNLISNGDLHSAEFFLSKLTAVAIPRHNQWIRKKIYHAQAHAQIARHRGRLQKAEKIIQQVLQLVNQQGYGHIPMAFLLHRQLGNIYYHQNKLKEARQCAANAVKYCEYFGLTDEILAGNELWLQLHLAAGEKGQAARCIQNIHAYAIKVGMPKLAVSADLCKARLAIEQGNLSAASLWSQRRNLQADDEPFSLLLGMECLTQAHLFFARGLHEKAAQLLATIRNRCIKRNLGELVLHIDILQSAIFHTMNEPEKAISLLKKALAISEIEGYVRPFVNDSKLISPILKSVARQSPTNLSPDHLGKVLTACGIPLGRLHPKSGLNKYTNIVLTQREIEILEWVSQGFQNKEIAQKAFIAIPTVKSHISSIMFKLNAKTRTQAFLRAKEMNIF